MAVVAGQLVEAELRFNEALAEAQDHPDDPDLVAAFTLRLAAIHALRGEGDRAKSFAKTALHMRKLGPADDSQARTIRGHRHGTNRRRFEGLGRTRTSGPHPARVKGIHADGLAFRGVFHLLAGDLKRAVADLTASHPALS